MVSKKETTSGYRTTSGDPPKDQLPIKDMRLRGPTGGAHFK
jgi:hypothetical protein